MALSLSNFSYRCVLWTIFCIGVCHAATVQFDWNITWVSANPDKAMDRPVMGINGQWPLPHVNVTKGDRLIVKVMNQLGNQSTSIHFHGMYQKNSSDMDGVVAGTQCGIVPGSSFTYNFTVDQIGTYWYHAHVKGQYPDGLRGPMTIRDPDGPYEGKYDEEVLVTLSDWYHDQMPGLISSFLSVSNPTGAEPVPDSALMNDSRNVTFSVEPGKTYLFHLVNMGALAAQYVWFEGHTMQIVEVDGVWTEPTDAEMIYITVAQRYSVLITARNDTSANFAIVGSMDQDLFDVVPAGLNPNVTGWLVYDQQKELPEPTMLDEFDPSDDFNLVPFDRQEIFDQVDQQVVLDMKMENLGDGAKYAFFNDVSFVGPKVPSLYTAMTTGDMATDPAVYGVNSSPFVLGYQQTIELVLNNRDAGKHPFHLHGHDFMVVARSEEGGGDYANNVTFPKIPMRRDTLLVRPNGNFVVRFRSDNPGVWLFHCHIEWHIVSGLVATIVEAPLEMQKTLAIPENHLEACRDGKVPYQGNAAGNTKDLLNLKGANAPPAPLPEGFTAKGIVAMTFSIISALLGMVVISWYGSAPLTAKQTTKAKSKIQSAGMPTE